eukprot:Gb_41277 [translate_table: standard]
MRNSKDNYLLKGIGRLGKERLENKEEINQALLKMYKIKKIKAPSYDGYNKKIKPQVWIHKPEQYFMIHPKDDNAKISFVAFHLEATAYEWWLNINLDIQDSLVEEIYSWEDFTSKLLKKNYDELDEDYFGTLKNLKQQVLQHQALCFRCKEKWKPDHKCANSKQINLIEILDEDEDGVEEANEEDQGDETIDD